MRQESNHRMKSSGENDSVKISNSRAMGVIVLIALLFLFQVVTFVWQKVREREVVAVESVAGAPEVAPEGTHEAVGKLFTFNPNTIAEDSLVLLGFSQRQAASIIKYRAKGGKFRVKRDFAKMYVVDSAKYASLERYILLPDSLPEKFDRRREVSVTKIPENVTNGTQNGPNVTDSSRNVTTGAKTTPYGTKVPKEKYVCNLNTADSAALVQLYGIGGYYARKILLYREQLGGSFVDVRQLLEIEGFSQERFNRLEGSIVVFDKDVKKFSLKEAPLEFLRKHPYIGPYAARGVETFLRLKGKDVYGSDLQLMEELVKERVISVGNANKLREYLLYL